VRLLPLWLFLGSLMIAPQLWWSPMLDARVDFIIYPLWLFVLAARGRLGEVLRFQALDGAYGFMYLWVILSSITNGWTEASSLQVFLYTKYWVVYRFTCASISTYKDLRGAGYAFVVLALVLAIEGIQHTFNPMGVGWAGQSFAWIDAESAKSIGLASRIRWVGIFDGPGVFCVVFTTALPFAFRYLAPPVGIPLRLIAATTIAAPLALAAYYTGSRGGILATAAMAGMFIISRFQVSVKRLILFGVLGFAALNLAPSYLTETKDSHGSAQGRVDMWAKGMEMVQQNPVFGIGRGNYARYTGRLVAHNSAIEAMGEMGFPGLFAWIAMLYLGFKGLAMGMRATTEPADRESLLAVSMAMAGYLVSSLFVSLETEIMYFLLGLMAGASRLTGLQVSFGWRDFKIVAVILVSFFLFFKIYIIRYY
jgi:hypothetical protein